MEHLKINGLELNVRAKCTRSDRATLCLTLIGRVERDTRDHPIARGTAVRLEETSNPKRAESRLIVLSPLEQALGLPRGHVGRSKV